MPFNFRKAIRLPLRVTAPIKIERKAVNAESPPMIEPGVASNPGSMTSSQMIEEATSAEAPPPKPLNSATISGMLVISTLSAATPPTNPPMTSPAMIQRKSTSPRSSRVVTMAISIARAARAFPRCAVRTRVSPLIPKMNSTADSR